MRILTLPKTAAVLALGCLVLTACAAPKPTTSTTPAGTTVSGTPTDDDAELKFMQLANRLAKDCTPDAPTGSSSGVPRPEDVPGGSNASPRYPAGATPPGTPDAEGRTPVPHGDSAQPAPDSTQAATMDEVPLNALETCMGEAHTKRITDAFKNADTSNYTQLTDKLTSLGYPAARIHQMPDQSGSPRARLDLRIMGSRLALEITATASTAVAEAFGAPESEGIDITQVKWKPALDAPTS